MTILTRRFTDAVDYARIAHAAQFRKGTSVPYIAHLLAVSATVLEYGGTEDMAIAGLLHDAGWTVAARAIDRAGVALDGRPGVVFCAEIDRRAHTLFGRAGRGWAITAAFQALCADARSVPLDQSTDPLAAVLRRAQVLAFEAPPQT